ncbi:hypothetical protein DM02DRAFT_320675 [Periconia macrospinosa]|uniref:Uncharacterized protein n=1 Tax=Periconia macrospinosa TaxID=97972 RepID=A0A2V1D0Y0_9PLEO|nr:hypothetical protein DM02DRAFT_320675 [Periconia macrospinosa]
MLLLWSLLRHHLSLHRHPSYFITCLHAITCLYPITCSRSIPRTSGRVCTRPYHIRKTRKNRKEGSSSGFIWHHLDAGSFESAMFACNTEVLSESA